MSDNIKVVVKVRPLISRELEEKLQHQWRVDNNTLFQIDSNGRDFGQPYTFDKVYCEDTQTSVVYDDVAKPIVEAAVAGFNGTIFAYGQTSSGKTYTMTGTEESPGIIPLAVLNLFETIKNVPGRDFVVSVSYIEIYNETLRDLLDLKKKVKIHDTYENSIKVDATDKVTGSPEEVLEAMKEGNANRQTGSTNMNESSSRSHSIFQINIESREHIEGQAEVGSVNVSQLNLVDLAGSERSGQTGATGIRFKEGTLINKSLTSLALVIKQLSEDPNKYINYRDSKLTRILQNSLGGNAKTSIICAITPAALDETSSTLQFATRAKVIKNKPEVNAVATDATMIQKLTKELSTLQSQLESKKNLEVMLESKKNVEQDLQKKIANLQRFILNGFGDRPNEDRLPRRKLPPRRITISTLHSIEEDIPKVPKFCTPSLKYNPSLVQNPCEFVPIQNPSKLSSLPEEPPRLVTPPLKDRKGDFGCEVIELDSDDDSSSGQICSPHHKCYGATKTPPCVLRKNAKQAEKNLKDIVELTEREKMYTPSVVELLEKIEHSNAKTAKLQDEIEQLKTISQEKDLEIEALRSKINTTEQEIKSFTSVTSELETQREGLNTKLTEWEVSYEKLKDKAKLRENELLSLLEEQKIKQAQDIGQMALRPKDKEIIHYMDMSKDISLVNSDNDSIVQLDEEPSDPTNILVMDMQAQLEAKNKNISELETDINTQKKHIERLEKSSRDLLVQVNSFKEKLGHLENENLLLRSTVDELNCTIKSQKENLESAQNDMKSYNSVIQELQIKLTKKDYLLNAHVNDSFLDLMLANEDKTISNNENLKNIIHSFKLALENSKKEINLLKSKLQNNNELEDKKIIDSLKGEISNLTKQANENMATINSLLREKSDLALIEQEYVKKISEFQQKNNEYEILFKEQVSKIEILKKENEKLQVSLAEILGSENEYSSKNETLIKQIEEARKNIHVLEEDVKEKNIIITNLDAQNKENQNCLSNAKLAINKLQNVYLVLTGEVRDIPDVLDSFVIIYNTLNENLNALEKIAVETSLQKDLALKNNTELKKEIDEMVIQHNSNISDMTQQIDNLNKTIQELTNEVKLLNDKNNMQLHEIEILKRKIDDKSTDLNDIEMHIKDLRKADMDTISEKDLVISSSKDTEIVLLEKINKLEADAINLTYVLKSKDDTNEILSNQNELVTQRMKNLEDELHKKCTEITRVTQQFQEDEKANELLIQNIISKLTNIIVNIQEKNSSLKRSLNIEDSNIREHIMPLLDAVVDYIIMQSPVDIENKELKSELGIISDSNKSLKCDLNQSSELLKHLQEELKIKAAEMHTIEHKAKEWKQQFSDLDKSMKEQMLFLQSENEKLKIRCLESTKTKINQAEYKNKEDNLTPPSLLTICCENIIKAFDLKQNDQISETRVENINTGTSENICSECTRLDLELRTTKQENSIMMKNITELENENKQLIIEQNDMREEFRSLFEPVEELQKKLFNHKTNLSILTATSYAENKSLKSQVKGLQHHHSRFHNVCQRDLPEFKKQLNELMAILKDDSSFCDGLNFTFKRYSLPNVLENNAASCQNRNESTYLDGDLLMLDTNNTFASADNTLVGYNQTCLDFTQTMLNETDCQTITTELNLLRQRTNILKNDNENLSAILEELNDENMKMKKQVTEYNVKLELLSEQALVATKQKEDFEKRYNDLVLEMPSTDALVHKLKIQEEDLKNKAKNLSKLTENLNSKSEKLNALQAENDLLSTQVMEHISDADDLNKEVEKLRQQNMELLTKCRTLEERSRINLEVNDEHRNKDKNSPNLNSSVSSIIPTDDKILSSQKEIHDGINDKDMFEDVLTIKENPDNSNMSMDLEESMTFELANDSLRSSPHSKKSIMPDIREEGLNDLYAIDRNDCYNYYLDKTGMDKQNLTSNIKILEIMKLLYNNLVTKHGNEVENLVNKLKDHQESQDKLQTEISNINTDYHKIKKDIEEKDRSLNSIAEVVTQLRDNLKLTKPVNFEKQDLEAYTKMSQLFKEKCLSILDQNFNLTSVHAFEHIIHQTNKLMQDYNSVNDALSQTKSLLNEKENECNLLKAQNESIQEINKAVTLDIVKKDEENNNIIEQTYLKLLELNMISPDQVPLTEPVNIHVLIRLLEHFINEYEKEKKKHNLAIEINDAKIALEEKEIQLRELLTEMEVLRSNHNKNEKDLSDKDFKIKKLEEDLNVALNSKAEENDRNHSLIENLSNEVNKLKEIISHNESMISSLSHKAAETTTLLNTVRSLEEDNNKLKTINAMITKESESYAAELEKSCATIKQNNIDIDKMTSDILVLRESVNEATAHVDRLKQEMRTLAKENDEFKQQLEVKTLACSRLEINIKTHEKTAEVQSRMIMRMQKVKEEDDKGKNEILENLNNLTEKYEVLQKECETLRNSIKISSEEIENLKIEKEALQHRLTDAEESGRRSRTSIDTIADASKRRRQSMSKRFYDKPEEHKNLEAVFESRQKPDDLFMDVDDEVLSGRSTPFGLKKGRDSLLSRTDHSDKDDEHPSRPNSALARAARRRRQSSHDLHRSVTPNEASPIDLSNYVIDELEQSTSRNRLHSDNEITQLRAQLSSCEQELEDLKERYKELDEECETCSEYLRERDEQCSRLKKEKAALQDQVTELKTKASSVSSSFSNSFRFKQKPSVAHVSVNTDEDWANLHAVVVDRMSYDAEVEKNKKLTKTIEELRFTKLDLKNTLAKMQKALEKNAAKDNSREMERIKQELRSCKDELKDLRLKYKELDDECETCAKYLKEREEQCRQLKEAKAALEARLKVAETKLEEMQESHQLEHAKTVRKKRQTIHDLNRPETSAVEQIDASTETTNDFMSSQKALKDSMQGAGDESPHDVQYLKKMVEMLTVQKAQLEHQLRLVHASQPMFVATGSAIVQNQQITDVMKENQKLKKINAKLVHICKKRGRSANRENEDPCEQG